ncbi:hypothetical protein PR048_015151 [Dryococelus australis]|uniref:UDP-glucuronosyltransferase n=1 Tax=Dryococelus australis TaxID=614101 RepID=A0ABQ9HG58_9NEOP|nr:hypothetical protein PR048_015151 [Dryococelus australis]
MPLIGGFFSGISRLPRSFIPTLLYTHLTSAASALKTSLKNHFQMFEALMKALADRVHEDVGANHFPQKIPVPNYTDIDISGSVPVLVDNIDTHARKQIQGIITVKYLWEHTTTMCKNILQDQFMQELLNNEQRFDAVITEIAGSECSAIFSFMFKAPLIGVTTYIPFPWMHGRLGNPDHPAYNPGYFVPYNSKMNFWQRLHNTFCNMILIVGNHFFNNVPTNTLLKEYFGDNIPAIEEVVKNTSIIFVNSHFSITKPRATVPGYIKDIKKFIDESEHGVIYFSFGSLVQVQSFPPEKLQALLNTFAALPERVLMKYTGNQLPEKPDNVMIGKWLAQVDVLSHPKTKLFIGHGGLMGSQESVYAGVPILGIPLFADQELNIISITALGMAVRLDYDQLNKDDLLRSIRNMIDDKRITRIQGRGKRDISEKTHLPAVLFGTVLTCEYPGVTRAGLELGLT